MSVDRDVLRTVTSAWTEALGFTEIKANDEFFAAGGDSLLAIRMLEQVEKELGITYPVETFFLDDTFENLVETATSHWRERT